MSSIQAIQPLTSHLPASVNILHQDSVDHANQAALDTSIATSAANLSSANQSADTPADPSTGQAQQVVTASSDDSSAVSSDGATSDLSPSDLASSDSAQVDFATDLSIAADATSAAAAVLAEDPFSASNPEFGPYAALQPGDSSISDPSLAPSDSVTAYQNASLRPIEDRLAAASVAANARPTSNSIAEGLIHNQIELNLEAASHGGIAGVLGTNSTSIDAEGHPVNTVIRILNEAYADGKILPAVVQPARTSTSSATNATATDTTLTPASDTPFATLQSAVEANLASAEGTFAPSLTNLQVTGNFVNARV